MVIFGGSDGIGSDIAALAEKHGARVFTFSRSSTGTHVERRVDVRAAIDAVLAEADRIDFVVNTAGILPGATRVETSEETVYAATEINYLAPVLLAQEFFPHLRRTGGSLLNFTSSLLHTGPQGLQPLLVGEGCRGQPDAGAG